LASSPLITCARSYIKDSEFTMPSAPTATKEELLAACVAEQSVRLTRRRLQIRWTNCLPVLWG
jgi:hypothetical protein